MVSERFQEKCPRPVSRSAWFRAELIPETRLQFLAELFSRSETLRNVRKTSIALGAFLFVLVILHGLTSSFIVSGNCSGYATPNGSVNTNCTYIYDYSPLYLPAFLGAVLFSFAMLTTLLLPRTASNLPQANPEKSRPARAVRLLTYISVPTATVFLLLALASLHAWSGFPATYAGPCLIALIPGNLSWCYTLIWEGFWVDALFYTAMGYGIVMFLIPKIRPPHSPLPKLGDQPSPTKTQDLSSNS